MITVDKIRKEFGAQVLLDNVSFKINYKERVGFVGRNGHGKTTLFKILIGEEEADSGTVSFPKNYKIAYIKQNLSFTEDTVLKEGALGLAEEEKADVWKLEKILSGLGFSEKQFTMSPKELSGGFQVRLNLAKTLVSNPNLLLLDEPNNYLDIVSIRWLSRFLRAWQGELMLITHDKTFMDSVVTHTMGLHRKKIKKIRGNTTKYYEQLIYEEEVYEKTRLNDEKKIKDMEKFINKFRAKARQGSLVQSRIKTLNKLEKKNKLYEMQNLDFNFLYKDTPAKVLFSAKNLSFGYTKEKILIEDFSIDIKPHDRICIIGQNGKGKTTLLKLLAEKLKTKTGQITNHHLSSIGYYEQTNIKSLDDKNTVLEEIAIGDDSIETQRVRKIAGTMMFNGDNALKKIAVLSGGEKARVLLAKILVKPVNILMLDEPTNHLDMESTGALLKAIKNFKGAVIMVTHNEDFLNKLATKLIIFKNNKIETFDYTYKEFLNKISWDDTPSQTDENKQDSDNINKHSVNSQNTSQKNNLSKKERQKLKQKKLEALKPIKQEMKKLENSIIETEKKLELTNQELIRISQKPSAIRRKATDTKIIINKIPPKHFKKSKNKDKNNNKKIIENSLKKKSTIIEELSKTAHHLKKEIDNLYENLEKLHAKQEKIEKTLK